MAVDWSQVDKKDPAARARAVTQEFAEQYTKRPVVDANGKAIGYDDQPDAYRAAVTRAQHEASHGHGHRLPRLVDAPRDA